MLRNIFEIPYIIQNRPNNYLSSSVNLMGILVFIRGYQYGALDGNLHNEIITNINKWNDFLNYIIEKTVGVKFAANHSISIYEALKSNEKSEEEALDLFFKLLDEFIKKEGIKLDMN